MSDKRYTVTQEQIQAIAAFGYDWSDEGGIEEAYPGCMLLRDAVPLFMSKLALTPEPSADVVGRVNIDVIPQGSYRSWRALVADHEWMVKLSDVHKLIEIEVERRIKERKDEV